MSSDMSHILDVTKFFLSWAFVVGLAPALVTGILAGLVAKTDWSLLSKVVCVALLGALLSGLLNPLTLMIIANGDSVWLFFDDWFAFVTTVGAVSAAILMFLVVRQHARAKRAEAAHAAGDNAYDT